ncbi:alpha/beta hydrolase [Rhodococcoides fascians A25f]|uniref:alpha/beta fold hydrolase n=1 Tax=Rhodococcoides fascians TaxID=1828 RepID=UPI00055AB334|nr:alpha/beta hydrolase [Rhodococcus fascians]QII08166.1 alpha/beta hydrolase [Rhodococcus fascians A25f]
MRDSERLRWQEIKWDSHTRDISVDGSRVHLVDLNPTADEAVIFLHGISASWRWFIEILPEVARSRRAIGIDLPGFGGSQFSLGHSSFAALADSVVATCGVLGVERATVVGHSMGSIVATRLAADHPGLIERLVVTGGPILSLTGLTRRPISTIRDQPRAVATLLAELVTIGLPMPNWLAHRAARSPLLLKAALGPFVNRTDRLDPELMDQVMSALGAPGSFPALLSTASADPSAGLDRITCPTRIIRGPGDPLSPPADVQRFLDAVPAATAVEIEGTGHWPHIEKPVEFLTELTAFLDIPAQEP